MSNYTETAVINIPKECLADIKEGSGFEERLVKQISSELAERIMGILEREEEIIVGQTDLRVSEFKPTNSVEYRRQIHWDSLVRCKDCKYASPNGNGCTVYHFKRYETHNMSPDDFCSMAERRGER